jgi:hypothetical protein
VTAGVITQRFNQSINQTITAHRQGNTTPWAFAQKVFANVDIPSSLRIANSWSSNRNKKYSANPLRINGQFFW